jgi:RNA polymerase sigma-70 factor (ECF subfamily)
MGDSETSEPLTMVSDALLVERFRQGDEASYEELFLRHYDRVYGLLFRLVGTRHEAEDLAQEVFLRLYRRPLARPDNVTGWLYRVAMNVGYNALRAEGRRRKREQASSPRVSDTPSAEATATKHETQRQVRAALSRMKPRSAQMLLMRQMGFSYRELAEAVGIAPGSVGTLLNRAGEAFRKAYREVTGEEDART